MGRKYVWNTATSALAHAYSAARHLLLHFLLQPHVHIYVEGCRPLRTLQGTNMLHYGQRDEGIPLTTVLLLCTVRGGGRNVSIGWCR